MRGPKPKPTETKIQEGNPGKRALPEPVLIAGRPTAADMAIPPDELTAEAQAFWLEHVTRLVEVGVIDHVDRAALMMLAEAYSVFRGATRVIKEFGYFTYGSSGQTRAHPAVKIQAEARSDFLKLAEHFAMTPVARARLGLAEVHRRTLASELSSAMGDADLYEV